MGQRVNLYSKLNIYKDKCRRSESNNEKLLILKFYELDPKPDELTMNRLR